MLMHHNILQLPKKVGMSVLCAWSFQKPSNKTVNCAVPTLALDGCAKLTQLGSTRSLLSQGDHRALPVFVLFFHTSLWTRKLLFK